MEGYRGCCPSPVVTLYRNKQPPEAEWPAIKAHHTLWTEAASYIKGATGMKHSKEGNDKGMIIDELKLLC